LCEPLGGAPKKYRITSTRVEGKTNTLTVNRRVHPYPSLISVQGHPKATENDEEECSQELFGQGANEKLRVIHKLLLIRGMQAIAFGYANSLPMGTPRSVVPSAAPSADACPQSRIRIDIQTHVVSLRAIGVII
jgi:hypothetical protein